MTPTATNVVSVRFGVPDPRDLGPEFQRERDRERYRIYAIWPDGEAKSWEEPTPEALGTALAVLSEEGEFDGAVVGILDTKGLPRGSGVWICNPYASARSSSREEK